MGKWDSSRCYAVPAVLAAQGYVLRAEQGGDRDFLETLYIAVRWPELAAIAWTEEVKLAFLRDQFALQDRHYAEHYAEAEFILVEKQGQPLGRLYLFRGKSDIRIVDISLLPEVRSTGLGTALLRGVQEEARQTGRSVSIHVEKFNPAHRLYRRLGFQEAGSDGPYWLMKWNEKSEESELMDIVK